MEKKQFRFIDLFSGIGGFHYAMKALGGECVMASEIDDSCRKIYLENFPGTRMEGDIRSIRAENIPNFDVLCAGFPCQPFSKAGMQKGFQDPIRGNLFNVILSIIDNHKEVKYLILENVRNLADKTQNWDVIKRELMSRGFYITEEPLILSPTDFGIPQIRERVYILGIRKDIRNDDILKNGYIHKEDMDLQKHYQKCKMFDSLKMLEKEDSDSYLISDELNNVINAWSEFRTSTDHKDVGHTVWVKYFGVGIASSTEYLKSIEYDSIPQWKQKIVLKNRDFYLRNRVFIDSWLERNRFIQTNKLFSKFEWNCGTDIGDIRDAIIQIRQSGIRVKRPNFFPTLVAMSNTPIIFDKNLSKFRYITPREAANMQSFPKEHRMFGPNSQLYKQFGNSVNVKVVEIIAKRLFEMGRWSTNG